MIEKLWVDPLHGDDASAGTTDNPLCTLQQAFAVAEEGAVVCLRLPSDYLNSRVIIMSVTTAPLSAPEKEPPTVWWRIGRLLGRGA